LEIGSFTSFWTTTLYRRHSERSEEFVRRSTWVIRPSDRIAPATARWYFVPGSTGDKLSSQEKAMSILKSTSLVAGHYECRALAETLPVFTELLAMEVVDRTASVATLKHPNTEWRLIVHEGGPNAPEKSFDNHCGFRVAHHEEVEAACKHLEANKEKYGLSKITKPQSAHFAYLIYFREPGGNHLEIEYYNPGGAQHGRAHTAVHWDKPLADISSFFAAPATPVSPLSCHRARRRSTLKYCVKRCAEPLPIRSTAKPTRNSLRSPP
jgi:hypothetical protein